MAPRPLVAEMLLTLRPVLRRPAARLIALRYGVGPVTARIMTAAAFRYLAVVQATRRGRARVRRALRRGRR